MDALVFAGIFAGILEGAEDAGGAEGGRTTNRSEAAPDEKTMELSSQNVFKGHH